MGSINFSPPLRFFSFSINEDAHFTMTTTSSIWHSKLLFFIIRCVAIDRPLWSVFNKSKKNLPFSQTSNNIFRALYTLRAHSAEEEKKHQYLMYVIFFLWMNFIFFFTDSLLGFFCLYHRRVVVVRLTSWIYQRFFLLFS